jgi:hypothetical protein
MFVSLPKFMLELNATILRGPWRKLAHENSAFMNRLVLYKRFGRN